MSVHAIGSGSQWDDRRNSSQTRAPNPRALADCLSACAALRRSDPRLVAWIEEGHPTLTRGEHVARFGASYASTRLRRST